MYKDSSLKLHELKKKRNYMSLTMASDFEKSLLITGFNLKELIPVSQNVNSVQLP